MPGPAHDTAADPSPGVNVNAAGRTVTCDHNPAADARAVNTRNDAGDVQNQVNARTTPYGRPSANTPAGYRPVVGAGIVNDFNACCANCAGLGPSPGGGAADQNVNPPVPGNALPGAA